MSRKPIPDDFSMDNFLSGEQQDEKVTPGVQPTDKRKPMKKYQIRMNEKDWTTIALYCQDRGLSISAFIRMATKEYMNKQGI